MIILTRNKISSHNHLYFLMLPGQLKRSTLHHTNNSATSTTSPVILNNLIKLQDGGSCLDWWLCRLICLSWLIGNLGCCCSLGLKVGPISISNFGWFVGPDPLLYQQWFLLLDLKYSDRRPFSRQNHF